MAVPARCSVGGVGGSGRARAYAHPLTPHGTAYTCTVHHDHTHARDTTLLLYMSCKRTSRSATPHARHLTAYRTQEQHKELYTHRRTSDNVPKVRPIHAICMATVQIYTSPRRNIVHSQRSTHAEGAKDVRRALDAVNGCPAALEPYSSRRTSVAPQALPIDCILTSVRTRCFFLSATTRGWFLPRIS